MKQVIKTIVNIVAPITLIIFSATAFANSSQSVQIIGSSTCDDFGIPGEPYGCRIEPLRWVQPYPTSVLKRLNLEDSTGSITIRNLGTQSIELVDTDMVPEQIAVPILLYNNGPDVAFIYVDITFLDRKGETVLGPLSSAPTPVPAGFMGNFSFGPSFSLPTNMSTEYHDVRLDIDVVGGPVVLEDLFQVNVFPVRTDSRVNGNPDF